MWSLIYWHLLRGHSTTQQEIGNILCIVDVLEQYLVSWLKGTYSKSPSNCSRHQWHREQGHRLVAVTNIAPMAEAMAKELYG